MYQALYRKWRPRTFDDVVGQSHITDTLKNQVRTEKLSHAYLFIGTRGTGKTTCAKILARVVNCENPKNGNPCNKCKSCVGIEDGSILDVVELDAASNNGVDNVRALRDEAIFSPAYVKKRVYIIDEVHMLSGSAFNALLKILEEPPAHLMFILATTELHKVPATVLSRCQRHSFKRLDSAVISKQLKYVAAQEHFNLSDDASELLGRLADGALRDGLTLLDQCSGHDIIDSETILQSIGLAGNKRTAELLGVIAGCDTNAAMMIFRNLWQNGKEPSTILDELCTLARDILMTIVAPGGGRELLSGGYDAETLTGLAEKMSAGELIKTMDTLRKSMIDLRNCPSPKTVAELCIIELCRPEQGTPVRQVPIVETEQATVKDSAKTADENDEKPQPHVVEAPKKLEEPEVPEVHEVPEVPEMPEAETETEEEYVFDDASESEEELTVPEELPAAENTAAEYVDVWNGILKVLKGKLSAGNYAVISDSFHGEGALEDGNLVIRAKSGFSKGMFTASDVVEAIKTAAAEIIGKPVPVKVTNGEDKPAETAKKLDAFAEFGDLIKFE